jgi:hypothetical protein
LVIFEFYNHVCGSRNSSCLAVASQLARNSASRCSSILHILFFHIANDGLPTIVHMDVLDADKLLAAGSQATKNLNLGRISPHQTSRRRSEGRNSLLRCEGDV